MKKRVGYLKWAIVLVLFSFALTSCTTSDLESSDESEISAEANKLGSGNVESAQSSLDDALDADEGSAGEVAGSSGQDVVDEYALGGSDLDEDLSLEEEFMQNEPAMDVAQEDFSIEDDLQIEDEAFSEQSPVSEPPQPLVEDFQDESDYLEMGSDASRVTITGLDFKANENGGTIVVQANGPIEYSTRALSGENQFVLEMSNVVLPRQFQRPYNTKEFSGPVGLINAQEEGGIAKVIVQLKGSSEMSVLQEGNSLLLVPGGAIADTPSFDSGDQVTQYSDVDVHVEEGALEPEPSREDSQPLATKTLDEFLMGDTQYYGRKISIEVSDGDLREVINFISEESGVNLILSDEVKGKVSVKLRQIPWDQALVLVMQTKQLGYIRQGNVLRIAPLVSIRNEAEAARQLLESQKLLEPLKVKIFPVSYARAKELEPQASGFLSTRGSAKADERTNTLVVRDISENILKVEKLIQNLDTQTPQVYIEGRIVETRSSLMRKIGINWKSAPSKGTLMYGLSSKNLSLNGSIGLEASLDLMETEDEVKVLSAPRIVTLNNQLANIEQVTQFPIYNETVDQNNQITRSVEYKPIKLNLNVTPQITADGGVILKTELLREFAGAIDQNAGDSGARSINSRAAKTTILVENGQTAVLGGIYQSDNTRSNSGLPLLRKIPILGWLFGQDNDTFEKNELLIFLTPRILNRDRAFQISEGVDSTTNL